MINMQPAYRSRRGSGFLIALTWSGVTMAACADNNEYVWSDAELARQQHELTIDVPFAGAPPTVECSSALHGKCLRVYRAHDERYLDAYTGGNGDVVMRSFQGNDTQAWCFTRVGSSATYEYRIQHRNFDGQYVDAYGTSTYDYKLVLRDFQNNDTQLWQVTGGCEELRLQQKSNFRYLDAHTSSANNYRAVTRTYQSNATQEWYLY